MWDDPLNELIVSYLHTIPQDNSSMRNNRASNSRWYLNLSKRFILILVEWVTKNIIEYYLWECIARIYCLCILYSVPAINWMHMINHMVPVSHESVYDTSDFGFLSLVCIISPDRNFRIYHIFSGHCSKDVRR